MYIFILLIFGFLLLLFTQIHLKQTPSKSLNSKLAIIIPTLPRIKNTFNRCIKSLKKYYKHHNNIYVYSHEKKKEFKHIPRKKYHKELLNNTSKRKKWEANLLLDFCDAMEKMYNITKLPYIMWLEDDSIIKENFYMAIEQAIQSGKNKQNWGASLYKGIGGSNVCIIIQRKNIPFIVNSLKKDIFAMPLDWFLGRIIKNKYSCNLNAVTHMGPYIGDKNSTFQNFNK